MAFPVGAAILGGSALVGGLLAGKKQGEANEILRQQLELERRRHRELGPLRALFFTQLGRLGHAAPGDVTAGLPRSSNPFAADRRSPVVRTPSLPVSASEELGSLGELLLGRSVRDLRDGRGSLASAIAAAMRKHGGSSIARKALSQLG